MTFYSSVLGEVQHPINILQEYLELFGNKCQAAIVSWLDGWAHTKRSQGQDEWAWLTLSSLSKELGYCRDTIHTHLKKLLEAGVIERKLAKRWPTDSAWSYRLVPQKIQKIFIGENQTAGSPIPDCGQAENQTAGSQKPDYFLNTSPNPIPKPNLRKASEIFPKEEVIEDSKELVEEVSFERKKEILEYMGVTFSGDQFSAPDLRGEKISPKGNGGISQEEATIDNGEKLPVSELRGEKISSDLPANLKQKLDLAGVEVCAKVFEAIASHHLSQALGAAQHCIDTGATIKNPKGVFLFQISRQPVEPIGPRLPVRTAADFQVESAPCPPEIREEAHKIIARIREESRQEKMRLARRNSGQG
ncbi:MAG: winged helix-turn-helix transcriptional regulator [Symploca sp. SIO2E6]|nr:winged helix-turn-helix transcriptional regulator [Symploca sp. SIO2E6]